MATVQVCPKCGETFAAFPSARRVFCSKRCFAANGGKHGPKQSPIVVEATRIGYCAGCGKVFRPVQGAPAGYCGQRCRHEARKQVATRYFQAQPKPAGREYPERTCRQCGETFKPWRSNQVNCSDLCKQIASNRRVRFGNEQVPCATCRTVLVDRKPGRPVCDGCRVDKRHRPEAEQRRRFRKYGVTEEWYVATLAAQGGACAICRTPNPGGKGWSIDHCHASGAARGVLCPRCNTALGLFSDDPEAMRRAAHYVEQHSMP